MSKKCSNVRGFSCGKTCISRYYQCRIELSGQAIQIASTLRTTIQAVNNTNGLFPDPNSIGDLPPLPTISKPEPDKKPEVAKPQFKLPDLDVSKVDGNKLTGLTDAEQATEIAKQLKDTGYNGETIVKGSIIMLPENGIINVNNGDITSFNLSSKLVPVLDEIRKKSEVYKPFATGEEALKQHSKVQHTEATYSQWGIKNPVETLEAVEDYTGTNSTAIKFADAGLTDDEEMKRQAELINDFIDKAPAYEGVIYSGFKQDMVDVYGVERLEVGDEFKFPSITSFSSSEDMAAAYAGGGLNTGGMFVVNNNKTASSVRERSIFKSEDEVLTNSTVNYQLKNKYYDKDKEMTVYEISEMSRDSNKEYSEQVDKNKQQPKPEKDRANRWQPVAPLIIKKKSK